jgi:hypothetical protein
MQRRTILLMMAAGLLLETSARADVPAGYKGKPFDPAVAGGVGIIPPTVKAGPYVIPGRLDFINYDLGGQPVAYSVVHHETKNGAGYRTDDPVATFSLTAQSKMDVWYDTGGALDGTFYPSATTADFYDGALDANDYFNYTVDVQTAGTYTLSTTFASGNGPPGGEGGDGTMGLQISVNGTMMVDWKDSFPGFATKANYHNWKPYPAFATLALDKGLQVLKFQCTANHLNLDYVQFALVGADAGASPDAPTAGDGGALDASGAAGDATGTAGASGAAGAAVGAAGGGVGSAGAGGESGAAGAVGGGGGGTAGAPAKSSKGGGCSYAPSSKPPTGGGLVIVALIAIVGSRARRRRVRGTSRGAITPTTF